MPQVSPAPTWAARVSDQVAQAEPLAAVHLVQEGGDGAFPESRLGGGQVDQVGVVGHHLADGGFGLALAEFLHLGVVEGAAPATGCCS